MDQYNDSATMRPSQTTGNGEVSYASKPAESSSSDMPVEQGDMPPSYAPSSEVPPSYPPSATPEDRGASESDDSDVIAAPVTVPGQATTSAPIIVVSGNHSQDTVQQGKAGQAAATASKQAKNGGRAGKSGRGFGLLETLAFLIGLAIFLYPLLAAYVNYSKDSSAVDNYDQIVDALSPAQRRAMWRDAKKYDEELGKPTLRDPFKYKEVKEPLGRYYKILNVDGKGMMAYVEIPKINVKLPVRHGTSDEVLKDGTGHIATTHVPTDNRTIHSVITGHTGEVGYMLFDNLTQLRKGDVFQIRVLKRHMSYKVDQIKIILPTDVSALQPVQNSNYVTLLTCYPYGVNSHRLIVRGHYIGDDVPPTQPEGAPIYMVWVLLALSLIHI